MELSSGFGFRGVGFVFPCFRRVFFNLGASMSLLERAREGLAASSGRRKRSKVKQANRSQCGNREWVACRGVKQEGNDMLSLYVRLFSFSGERELNGLVLCSVWFLCRWAVWGEC